MQILNRQEQLKRQLAEQRVVDRHAGRMEDLGATAEETLSNGAVIGGVLMAGKSPRSALELQKAGKIIQHIQQKSHWMVHILIQLFKSVVCGPQIFKFDPYPHRPQDTPRSQSSCTGPGFSGISAVDSAVDRDVGTMDASQELRARLAALRGQLNQGTKGRDGRGIGIQSLKNSIDVYNL